MKTLFKIKTQGLGDYYVIATHPTEACDKLTTILNKSNYGFINSRKIKEIVIVTEECGVDDLYGDKLLVL